MREDDPKIPPFGPARIPALATPELTKGLAAIKTEDALRARAKRERRQEAVWAPGGESYRGRTRRSHHSPTSRGARAGRPRQAAFANARARADRPLAPDREIPDGPQAELVRLFFQEAYSGHPPKKMGYRRLRERMEVWAVEKNRLDGGNRVAASESTIRRVRNAL